MLRVYKKNNGNVSYQRRPVLFLGGLNFLLDYRIDTDCSIWAGNLMWVSSSAFERSITTLKLDPTEYGKTIDMEGD